MSKTPTSTPAVLPALPRRRFLAPPEPQTGFADDNRRRGAPAPRSPGEGLDCCARSPRVTIGPPADRDFDSIRKEAETRCISRLCHFTASGNVVEILSRGRGIRSTECLEQLGRARSVATDSQRRDGHPDHVCLSVQFPNAWCFRSIREERGGNWVVLFVESKYLWQPGTKFCPVNAARESGGRVAEGAAAFREMFASTVNGFQTYTRGPHHPDYLPTDEQAEVRVPHCILPDHIVGIAVRDEAQAAREYRELLGHAVAPPPLAVAPEFYDPECLSVLLRNGKTPKETPWRPQE